MSENEINPVYPKIDHMQLDADGGYYCRHVAAMTDEGLHKKSDIAGQLGMRDRDIDRLTAERDAAVADAERYRWLRDRKFSFSHDQEWRGISGSRWGNWPYDTDEGHSSVMDKAIDAAMKEQEQGK